MKNNFLTLSHQFILSFSLQTTSRAGWHTPDDDVLSPKSDHLHPHFNMVKSLTTSPKSIFRKKSSTLDTHVTTHYNNYSKSVDSNQYNHTVEVLTLKQSDFTPMATVTATKSQESTSKYASAATVTNQNHTLSYCSTTTTSSSSSEMLEQRTVNRFEYDSHSYRGMYDSGRTSGAMHHGLNGGSNIAYHQTHQPMANIAKYDMPYQYVAANNGSSNNQNHHDDANLKATNESARSATTTTTNGGAPRNRCLPKNGSYDEYQNQAHDMNGCEGRYGKLLNRTLNNDSHHSIATNANNNQSQQTHDRYNANVQYQPQPSKLINGIDNCTNNNSTIQLHVAKANGYSNFTPPLPPPSSTTSTMGNGMPPHGKMGPVVYGNGTVTTVVTRPPPNKDGVNGNGYLRGPPPSHHRYSNGHLTAPGNHPLAHLIGSLSSPESAYSTGYSTDGTSPGKKTRCEAIFRQVFLSFFLNSKTNSNCIWY